MKKRKIRQRLSPLQQERVRKICLVLGGVALLWVLFMPRYGLVSLWGQRSELKKLSNETAELAAQNEALEKEIQQIKNDPEHLEKIAREKNFLKKNEQVYDFSPSKKQKHQ